MLRIYTAQGDVEEVIIAATDDIWARNYADTMGFFGPLKEVRQPTAWIRVLDADERE